MGKVYLVTLWEDPVTKNMGVFSTIEKAHEMVDRIIGNFQENEIEVFRVGWGWVTKNSGGMISRSVMVTEVEVDGLVRN